MPLLYCFCTVHLRHALRRRGQCVWGGPCMWSAPLCSLTDCCWCCFIRLHEATGDMTYLRDAEAFYDKSRSTEKFSNPNPDLLSYENVIPALHLMLFKVGQERGWSRKPQAFCWQQRLSKSLQVLMKSSQ